MSSISTTVLDEVFEGLNMRGLRAVGTRGTQRPVSRVHFVKVIGFFAGLDDQNVDFFARLL